MIRLKELRMNKGLSRKEVAEQIGIKQRTYLSYENCEREPNSEMLIALASFFDVSIDYLIGRVDNLHQIKNMQTSIKQKELTSDEEQLLTNYNKLNTDGKDKVQDYTKDLTGNKIYTDKLQDKLHA